jgi:Ca2+-binding EF-hand superfamily protein
MKKLILMTAAAVFVISPAMADDHKGKKDGKKLEEMFKSTDSDSDGMISLDEYLAHVEEKAGKKFSEKDTNDDGMVSMDEAKAYNEMKKDKYKEKWSEKREKMKEKRQQMREERAEETVAE